METNNNESTDVIVIEEPEKVITDETGSFVEVYKPIDPKLRSPGGRAQDPRQQLAWDYYVQSWKEGRPNAKASGLKAGYTLNTSINLNSFKWFKERKARLKRSIMMSNAERNLHKILNMKYSKMQLMEDGTEKEVVDKDVLKVVADISKTIVQTLGKDDGYSTKTEIGGKMDTEIKINSISYADPIQIENKIIDESVNQVEQVQNEVVKDIIENKKEE